MLGNADEKQCFCQENKILGKWRQEEEKEEEEKEEELSICSGKMTEPITFCGPNVSNLFDKWLKTLSYKAIRLYGSNDRKLRLGVE